MSRSLRFLAAFVVYAVIDMAWNMSPPAVAMYANLHEASGNDWSFGKPMDTWGGLELVAVIVFFALIALANSHLAIGPAIRERDLQRAMKNGFLLGCAAYATYIVPTFIQHRQLAGGARSHRYPDRRVVEPGDVGDRDLVGAAPSGGLKTGLGSGRIGPTRSAAFSGRGAGLKTGAPFPFPDRAGPGRPARRDLPRG